MKMTTACLDWKTRTGTTLMTRVARTENRLGATLRNIGRTKGTSIKCGQADSREDGIGIVSGILNHAESSLEVGIAITHCWIRNPAGSRANFGLAGSRTFITRIRGSRT